MKPAYLTIVDLWEIQRARKARRERLAKRTMLLIPVLLALVLHQVW